MDARRARVDAALKIEAQRRAALNDGTHTTTTMAMATMETHTDACDIAVDDTSASSRRIAAMGAHARRALERAPSYADVVEDVLNAGGRCSDDVMNLAQCARERELEREDSVREMRYDVRRAMIDEAETSAPVHDALAERWNALMTTQTKMTHNHGDGDDIDENDDDDIGDDKDTTSTHLVTEHRADPMRLHTELLAHVAECADALRPKSSLVARMEHRCVVDDAERARAFDARRDELRDARSNARQALDDQTTEARETVHEARARMDDVGRRMRDGTRRRALMDMDDAMEHDRRHRVDVLNRDARDARDTLIELELANVDEGWTKRLEFESREDDARLELRRATVRAPMRERRAMDACEARAETKIERENTMRAMRRRVKTMRMALYDAKRRYAAMEEFHARLDARLRLRRNESRERLRRERLRRVATLTHEGEKTAAICAMKRARVIELAKALEAVERDIWKKVFRAPNVPQPISTVVAELLVSNNDGNDDGWNHDALRRVLDERTRAWVRVERAQREQLERA